MEKKPSLQQWRIRERDHITLAKYALIEIGMTREEVEKIISWDGSTTGEPVSTDETQKRMGDLTSEYSIEYKQGKNVGYARITYRGKDPGKVIRKMQQGLQ